MTLDHMESQLIDVMGALVELRKTREARGYQSIEYYTAQANMALSNACTSIRFIRAQMEKNAEAEGQLEALSGMQKAANVY